MTDTQPALSAEEFASLIEVGKGEAQQEIPQLHWERLVALGYAIRRLGELDWPDRFRPAALRRKADSHFRSASCAYKFSSICTVARHRSIGGRFACAHLF